jgi:hypothetical protein
MNLRSQGSNPDAFARQLENLMRDEEAPTQVVVVRLVLPRIVVPNRCVYGEGNPDPRGAAVQLTTGG